MPLPLKSATIERDSLYSIRGLTKIYGEGPTAVSALRGVDLELPKSAMVVLLGASGSGKSTFLNIIGGLDEATAGTVMFEDQELTALGPSALTEYRRNSVSFVFQFYNLVASLTARENVALITEIGQSLKSRLSGSASIARNMTQNVKGRYRALANKAKNVFDKWKQRLSRGRSETDKRDTKPLAQKFGEVAKSKVERAKPNTKTPDKKGPSHDR